MKAWWSRQEQSGASEVKSDEGISSKSEQNQAPAELGNKRARLDATDSPEDAAARSTAILVQLCKAANQPPPTSMRAENLKTLICQLCDGGPSPAPVLRQVQDLMHAAFVSVKAGACFGLGSLISNPEAGYAELSSQLCAFDLSKLVEDALLVQCWLTRGLPSPKPLKSAQVATIIADVLQELENCEGPALDFHALADTSSQVVQVVGEDDAVRPSFPGGQSLLMHVLLSVNSCGTGASMTRHQLTTAHDLGLSLEEANRHAVALALASATRPSACQLLHTIRMFEGAVQAASTEAGRESASAEQHDIDGAAAAAAEI